MSGVQLYFCDPLFFQMDCKVCRRYVLDKNGQPETDVTGQKIRRPKKPDCRDCPREHFKKGWLFDNEWWFKLYLVGRAFGRLPYAGGLLQQPRELIDVFCYMYQLERLSEGVEDKRALESMLRVFSIR